MFFRDALPTPRRPLAKVSFYLLHLLRSLPNGVGTGCRQQLRCLFGLPSTEALLASTGDVFPLLSSLSVEDEALVSLAAQPRAHEPAPVKQQVTAGKRVWLQCVISVLNLLHFAPQSLEALIGDK